MKKILSVILTLVLLVAMSVPAMAVKEESTPQTSVKLHYSAPKGKDIDVQVHYGTRNLSDPTASEITSTLDMAEQGGHFYVKDNGEYVSASLIKFTIQNADIYWNHLDVEFKPEGGGTLNVWIVGDVVFVDIVYTNPEEDSGTAQWTGDHAYFTASSVSTDAALTFRPVSGYHFVSITDTADSMADDPVEPLADYPEWTYHTIYDIQEDHIVYVDTAIERFDITVDVHEDGTATPEGLIGTFDYGDSPSDIIFEAVTDYQIIKIEKRIGDGPAQTVFEGTTESYSDDPGTIYGDIDYDVYTDFIERPEITLIKEAGQSSVNVEEPVTYYFTVENTGNVPLSNVAVTDLTYPALSVYVGELDVGESQTLVSGDTLIFENAGIVNNTAEVMGYYENMTAEDTAEESIIVNDPNLQVEKTAIVSLEDQSTLGSVSVFEEYYYRISVTNTGEGNVAITDLSVIDAELSFSETVPVLAVGATETFFVGPVSHAHPQTYINTAVAIGDVNGVSDSITSSDDDVIDVVSDPSIAVMKAAVVSDSDPTAVTSVNVGETFVYRFMVTNTGDMPLNDVVLMDEALWNEPYAVGSLVPGESVVIHSSEVSFDNPGVVTNTVSVKGYEYEPNVWQSDSAVTGDDSSITMAEVLVESNPSISLQKMADQSLVNIGDVITYSFSVENTGDVPLRDILLTDPMFPGWSYEIANLAVGEIHQVEDEDLVHLATVTGILTNTGYVSALEDVVPNDDSYVAKGREIIHDEASAELAVNDPRLSVEKVAIESIDTGSAIEEIDVGNEYYYRITVTNIGDEALYNVQLSDPMFPDFAPFIGILKAGDTQSFDVGPISYGYPTTVVNAASAEAVDSQEAPISSHSEEITVSVVANPDIQLDKTVNRASLPEGEMVMYQLTITNTGDMPLMDVVVVDPMFPDLSEESVPELAPGESHTIYRYAVLSEPGDIVNIAEVMAYPYYAEEDIILYKDDVSVMDMDDAEVSVMAYGIELEKEADDAAYETGEAVTYTFKVKNTGEVSYRSVLFSDSLLGIMDLELVTLLEPLDGSFDPGDAVEFTEMTTYDVVGEMTNIASVKAYKNPLEAGQETEVLPVAEAEDQVTVTVSEPNEPNEPDEPNRPSRPSTREYTLTLEVEGEGSFTITSLDFYEADYERNDSVDVSFEAASGWVFSGYSDDSDDADIDSDDRIIMDSDKYIKIIFTQEQEEEDEIILDEPEIIPEALPEAVPGEEIPDDPLPQTGGIPIVLYGLFGTVISSAGIYLRKKR